LSDEEGAPKS